MRSDEVTSTRRWVRMENAVEELERVRRERDSALQEGLRQAVRAAKLQEEVSRLNAENLKLKLNNAVTISKEAYDRLPKYVIT